MVVATLRLELLVPDCPNLREKRRRMQAIVDKLHRHFNVAAAEVGRHDRPSEAVLAVAAVGATRRQARDVLDRVAEAVAHYPRAEVLRFEFREA